VRGRRVVGETWSVYKPPQGGGKERETDGRTSVEWVKQKCEEEREREEENGWKCVNSHTQLRVDVFLATSQRSVGGRDWGIRDRGVEHWHKCVWRSRKENCLYIWMNCSLSVIEMRRWNWGVCQDFTDLFNFG